MEIKESLVFVFVFWMQKGGHNLNERKGNIVMRKNGKVAEIYFSDADYYEINDYCKERYELFLTQWFKYGVEFIKNLKREGALEVMRNRGQRYLELKR